MHPEEAVTPITERPDFIAGVNAMRNHVNDLLISVSKAYREQGNMETAQAVLCVACDILLDKFPKTKGE